MSAGTIVIACLLFAAMSLQVAAMPTAVITVAVTTEQTNCSAPCVYGACDTTTGKCMCQRGYEGENCSVPICSKAPCPSDFDCVMRSYATDGFVCVYNPCASHPCLPGEICLIDTDKPEGYKCTEDPCSSISCYNKGTCVFDKQEETVGCECIPPFDSRTDCFRAYGCHTDLNPCSNGGTCTEKFTCDCPEGYSGRLCDTVEQLE